MKIKHISILVILSGTLLSATTSSSAFNLSKPYLENGIIDSKGLYPVNENGQTFGTVRRNVKDPDLIAAQGIDGTLGYVRSEDLVSSPHTLEEARALEKTQYEVKTIPLYDKDGVTIIGKFELKSN